MGGSKVRSALLMRYAACASCNPGVHTCDSRRHRCRRPCRSGRAALVRPKIPRHPSRLSLALENASAPNAGQIDCQLEGVNAVQPGGDPERRRPRKIYAQPSGGVNPHDTRYRDVGFPCSLAGRVSREFIPPTPTVIFKFCSAACRLGLP